MPLIALAIVLLAPQDAPVQPAVPAPDMEVPAPAAEHGVVQLECVAIGDGRVRDCRVLSETPEGRGFGEAAIEAAGKARLGSRSRGRIRFTTRFNSAEDDPRP